MRTRGSGAHPGEAGPDFGVDQARPLRPRLPGLVAVTLLLLLPACAGGPRPVSGEDGADLGVRVLFRVESEGPRGRSRFRMAAALRPPSAARLEFLGPAGGPRLVIATDGKRATALLPAERQFDTTPGSPEAMERLLGLPLDGERLIALLSGAPICRRDRASGGDEPRPGTPPGPGDAVPCPQGDIVFSGVGGEAGEPLRGAILSHRGSGAIIAEVAYADRLPASGARWPRGIRLSLPSAEATITLTVIDGPAAARLPESLFAPAIPADFEPRAIFGGEGDPALLGTLREKDR